MKVVTALLVALATAPLFFAQDAEERLLSSGEVSSAVDAAVRWMRASQDLETGGYGDGSAHDTALALLAYARCPRDYRRADGPFVARALEHLATRQRADGAFPDAHLQREPIDVNTALAATALFELGETGEGTPHAKALAYLGPRAQANLGFYGGATFETPALASEAAQALLALRSPDGSWPDGFLKPGPSLPLTAKAILQLSDAERALRAAEKAAPKAEPVPVRPLPPPAQISQGERERVLKALVRGAEFLASDAPDGHFGAGDHTDPGITAMVAGALLAAGEHVELSPAARAAADGRLAWLRSLQKEDGSIHAGQIANYVTSASILALAKSGKAEDAAVIARARDFLQRLQSDEGEGYDPSHHYYGGVGYGSSERPDLSNLQMALEALATAGLERGDPTFAKALQFLQRSQNRSESNDVALKVDGAVIGSGDDGGGVYAPGDSKAGFVELADGTKVPRSYGSMTYALLKSYLFAGLPKEDPRVEAAWQWLRTNYTLDVNPGFEASNDPHAAYQGLFYYYYTMAHALDLYGEETVVDAAGGEHAWRSELAGRLIALQRPDGSWVNENSERWWEGNPVLATGYALLTLAHTLKPADAAGSDGSAGGAGGAAHAAPPKAGAQDGE